MNKFLALSSFVVGIGIFVGGIAIATSPVEAKPIQRDNIIQLAPEYVVGEVYSKVEYKNPAPTAKKNSSKGKVRVASSKIVNQVRYQELEQGGRPDAEFVRSF